jgi:hypothetical protein
MPIKPIYQNPFPDDPTSYTAGEVTPSRYNQGSQATDSLGNVHSVDDLKNYNYYYVNVSTGADTNTGLSPTTAFKTIAHAVSLAGNGCKIILANGTYPEYGITISNDIEIIGTSESGTIINGTSTGRIFNISTGCSVKISNLTIENGKSNNGGAINNSGYLIMNSITVTGCNAPYAASSNIYAGGIWNEAVLKGYNCTFTNNTSLWGGAIVNDTPSYCKLIGCIFTDNSCTSPLDNTPSSFYVSRAGAIMQVGYGEYIGCTFTSNSAFEGGAVTVNSQNTFSMNNCTFTNNTSISTGAAINIFHAEVNCYHCTFSGNNSNMGAAIYLDGQSQASGLIPNILNLEECEFTGNYTNHNTNQPGYGTGAVIMSYDGIITAKDCIFETNTATMGGSVLYQEASGLIDCSSTFKNCTIENNTDTYGAIVIMGGYLTYDPWNTASGNTGSSGLMLLSGGIRLPNRTATNNGSSPAGLSWLAGDTCDNMDLAVAIDHWRCSVSGTPGTWVAVNVN